MCRTRCRLGPLSIFPLPHPSLRRPPAPTRVPGPPVSQMCSNTTLALLSRLPVLSSKGWGRCMLSFPPFGSMMPPSPLFQGTLPASFRILWFGRDLRAFSSARAGTGQHGISTKSPICDRGTPLENKFGPGGERKYNSIARGGGERASQRGVETAPVPA